MCYTKKIPLFILLCFVFSYSHAQNKFWLIDPLEPVYPDSNQTGNYSNNYTLHFAKGGVADVHVLLKLPLQQSFTITATLQGKPLPINCWSELLDVPVEENTGLDSRTEQYLHKKNPYVIRRAPFRIYEVLMPLHSNTITVKNNFTALRLCLPQAQIENAGTYKVDITVNASGKKYKGTFKAVVHDVAVPPLEKSTFFYTNWFNLVQMEQKHHVERWTDEWFAMLDKYAKLMAYGRQNCITIPGELMSVKNGSITLDEEKMYRFVSVFRKNGFHYFESPHIMYRGDNDDWSDKELKVALTKRRYYTPEARRDVDTIVRLIKKFTERYNLTGTWLQHISDEPTGIQAKCYKDVALQVKSIYPEIKIMEATNDRDSLVGAVDIWCPLVNDYQENQDFFNKRVAAGEKVLVYSCLIPGGKWLNRLLDEERLRPVYFGWGAAKYGTFGFLHWGLNQYLADPYTHSVVPHHAPGAAANNKLPAGDTHIVYPTPEGPVSSTRFEAHRIGIEDYELLEMLKKIKPAKVDELIESIFRNYTDYSTSVKEYRQVREKLLQAFSE